MALSREDILACDDRALMEVVVPEWKNGTVYLKVIGSADRDEFEVAYATDQPEKLRGIRAAFLSKTLCDAEGTLLFTKRDIVALGEKSTIVMERLFDLSTAHSHMAADAVDDAKKNSEPALSDASGSLLPLPSEDEAWQNGKPQSEVESLPNG